MAIVHNPHFRPMLDISSTVARLWAQPAGILQPSSMQKTPNPGALAGLAHLHNQSSHFSKLPDGKPAVDGMLCGKRDHEGWERRRQKERDATVNAISKIEIALDIDSNDLNIRPIIEQTDSIIRNIWQSSARQARNPLEFWSSTPTNKREPANPTVRALKQLKRTYYDSEASFQECIRICFFQACKAPECLISLLGVFEELALKGIEESEMVRIITLARNLLKLRTDYIANVDLYPLIREQSSDNNIVRAGTLGKLLTIDLFTDKQITVRTIPHSSVLREAKSDFLFNEASICSVKVVGRVEHYDDISRPLKRAIQQLNQSKTRLNLNNAYNISDRCLLIIYSKSMSPKQVNNLHRKILDTVRIGVDAERVFVTPMKPTNNFSSYTKDELFELIIDPNTGDIRCIPVTSPIK